VKSPIAMSGYCYDANFILHLEDYLRKIDSVAEATTSAPLREYTGFVSPEGNRSGLC
jgi:hypothetical protein